MIRSGYSNIYCGTRVREKRAGNRGHGSAIPRGWYREPKFQGSRIGLLILAGTEVVNASKTYPESCRSP